MKRLSILSIKTISILLFCSILFSCGALLDKSDPRRLKLENNSNVNIIFYRSNLNNADINSIDVALPTNRFELKSVGKESSYEYKLNGTKWEDFLDNFQNKSIIVFVLNRDSVVKYANPISTYPDLDTSRILKKQYVNIDTLINNNWRLTYP